jgi:hypothetical protein
MPMRVSFILFLLVGSSAAFSHSKTRSKSQSTALFRHNANDGDFVRDAKSGIATFGVAATIFASTLISGMSAAPLPANADIELSRGALIIQATSKGADSGQLLRAEVDSKSLIKALFQNRKALSSSLDRIQTTVVEELNSPAWVDVKKQILQFEGDVAPEIKFSPPADWQQTAQDIKNGKLNLLVNGEIINLSVDPKFSESEDDIVIRLQGFKGVDLANVKGAKEVARSAIQEKSDALWDFWQSPIPEKYLPKGVELDNGGTILIGSTAGITFAYAASYSYYMSGIEAEEAKAEAKRQAAAETKAAAAKKKGEEGASKKKAVADNEKIDTEETEKKSLELEAAKLEVAEKELKEEKEEKAAPSEKKDEDEDKPQSRWRFWKKGKN